MCNDLAMPGGNPGVPAHVLQAVADQTGRLALVVGAGCSLEPPTNLELSDEYSRRVHQKLVSDNVLDEGECDNPDDLSAVASVVWTKTHSQDPVVTRLPRGEFRDALANDGYLVAAALLREGAVAAVLTLNFDLAISNALGQVSAGNEVAVIASPDAIGDLGTRSVIYLHRNANEDNSDKWILRTESLTEEWKGRWEQVLAQRVLTSPVVVFAGLGSPAAVLTESVTWIKSRIDPEEHHAYVVDPTATSAFQAALTLAEDAHIQMGWCDFMACLDERMSTHLCQELETSCAEMCSAHRWDGEVEFISALCDMFYSRGLVASGKQRARWTLHNKNYVPDAQHVRGFVGYLLLGMGVAQRRTDTELTIRHDGIVEFRRDGRIVGSCLPISGEGTHSWTAIEGRANAVLKKMQPQEMPTALLIAGLQGTPPSQVTPPDDVGYEVAEGDILIGDPGPTLITIDEIREDPALAENLVT